ncbi:MAG: hypothetical protein SF162_01445 [bacterium]|nr:hypothetical protein [bacterium]
MGIELYWDNDERTVMLCEVRDPWTWEDLFTTLEKIKKITDRSETTIGAILDLTEGVTIPGGSIFNPTVFNHAKTMLQMGEGGTGPLVIVGVSPMIRTVFNAFRGMDREATSNITFTPSLDEGRRIMTGKMQQAKTA